MSVVRVVVAGAAKGSEAITAAVGLLVWCVVHVGHTVGSANTTLRAGERAGHEKSRDGSEADGELHDDCW